VYQAERPGGKFDPPAMVKALVSPYGYGTDVSLVLPPKPVRDLTGVKAK
jgi:hypothetical protein